MERHAGKLEIVYGPTGERLIQQGKDLTGVKTIIGTGGPIVFARYPREIMESALFRKENPFSLKPKNSELYIDEQYVFYAVGLLGQVEPGKALRLARKYLEPI